MHNDERIRHTIHSCHHHWCWNNQIEPVLRVSPGDEVFIATREASGGQIDRGSTAGDVARLDFSRVNPVTGPVFVEGAEPGDILVIKILDMQASGFGWTAIIPEFGLLSDQFPNPALKLWRYDPFPGKSMAYSDHARVFIQPMLGCVGVAPAAPGDHDILPPRRVGGTMDIRDIGVGSVLYLPVEVRGGLLSIGDTHAAQGDGEVCGTGLESAIDVTLRVDVIKQQALRAPRLEAGNDVTRALDQKGYRVTTGIGTDLMQGARDAVSGMIDLLSSEHATGSEEAYMLCSLCADLRINQLVNASSLVVSLYFPRVVFE